MNLLSEKLMTYIVNNYWTHTQPICSLIIPNPNRPISELITLAINTVRTDFNHCGSMASLGWIGTTKVAKHQCLRVASIRATSREAAPRYKPFRRRTVPPTNARNLQAPRSRLAGFCCFSKSIMQTLYFYY